MHGNQLIFFGSLTYCSWHMFITCENLNCIKINTITSIYIHIKNVNLTLIERNYNNKIIVASNPDGVLLYDRMNEWVWWWPNKCMMAFDVMPKNGLLRSDLNQCFIFYTLYPLPTKYMNKLQNNSYAPVSLLCFIACVQICPAS